MANRNDSLNLPSIFNPSIAVGVAEPQPEGVDLADLKPGTMLEIQTGHHSYRLVNKGGGTALISGHPTYCPTPVPVEVHGSIDNTGHLKWHFVGKGMKLAFLLPEHGVIQTSRITEIRRVKPEPHNAN